MMVGEWHYWWWFMLNSEDVHFRVGLQRVIWIIRRTFGELRPENGRE